MNVDIGYLADRPELIPTLAQWLFDEWGYRSPNGSVQGMVNILQARLNRDRLPMALVALQDGKPIGTVSLKIKEVEIRPQVQHWLGTLFVHKESRCQGVGSRLVRTAATEARRLGLESIYLYTRQQRSERLYAGLGWLVVERVDYRNRPAVIMRKVLDV